MASGMKRRPTAVVEREHRLMQLAELRNLFDQAENEFAQMAHQGEFLAVLESAAQDFPPVGAAAGSRQALEFWYKEAMAVADQVMNPAGNGILGPILTARLGLGIIDEAKAVASAHRYTVPQPGARHLPELHQLPRYGRLLLGRLVTADWLQHSQQAVDKSGRAVPPNPAFQLQLKLFAMQYTLERTSVSGIQGVMMIWQSFIQHCRMGLVDGLPQEQISIVKARKQAVRQRVAIRGHAREPDITGLDDLGRLLLLWLVEYVYQLGFASLGAGRRDVEASQRVLLEHLSELYPIADDNVTTTSGRWLNFAAGRLEVALQGPV